MKAFNKYFTAGIVFPFALGIVVLSATVAIAKADTELGDAISISIVGLKYLEPEIQGKVFKDQQGSYYVKSKVKDENGKEIDRIFKPQKGDYLKYKYKDENGKEQTGEVIQPAENLQSSTDKVHNYKDELLASLTPIPVSLGDLIYPLNVPQNIEQEFLSLEPPAFGENPINSVKFFGLGFTPFSISLVGSTSFTGSVESVFSLDISSQWITLSNDIEGRLAIKIVAGNVVPSANGNTVIIVGESIPEPSFVLSLLALGTLGAASTLKRQLKPSKSTEKETTKVG
ncbi:MAG: hypothetical protein ACK5N2_03615 [bacterium]|jgi:hypothetical protein